MNHLSRDTAYLEREAVVINSGKEAMRFSGLATESHENNR